MSNRQQTHRKHRKRGTGQVQLLPSGRFRARINFEGHRIAAPSTFDTRMDADAWLRRANREIANGTFQPPEKIRKTSTVQTLHDYAETWIKQRDLKPRTRSEYEGLIKRHVKETIGAKQLSDITPAQVRDWHSQCCPDRPRTRAAAYALVKSIFNTAVADDLIGSNPCRIKGASTARRETRTKLPTVDQLATLTVAMDEKYRAVIPLAAWCGLRSGEIAALTRSDIDIDAQKVDVNRAAVTLPGKGRQIASTKTEGSIRTVSIPEVVLPIIEQHLDDHVGVKQDSLLFSSPTDPARPVPAETLRNHWLKARAAAGVPELRLHDLRHFAGTTAAQSGATLAEVMARLGHKSAATALRYQHASPKRDAAIAAGLSDLATVTPIRAKA